MENCELQNVRVAVNIRPLLSREKDCIVVDPSKSQVQVNSRPFTFDYIFGSKGLSSLFLYDECVAPLVDSLFHGYNGTVIAYGQTGSRKTYTMGTNYNGEDRDGGVIPEVIDVIFSKLETMRESAEFSIRVSYVEILREEVFDLLEDSNYSNRGGLVRKSIQIRETASGGVSLVGVKEAHVRTKAEMVSCLLKGSSSRCTGRTNMNIQSSRSHAIFTIHVEQKRLSPSSSAHDIAAAVTVDDILIGKLHLVDLAGSQRAERTGADGQRLQEAIHIKHGLFSLGNVISALALRDNKKQTERRHIPYRGSKLTRILQDSFGGNCKTVMIACVSPAENDAKETLETLKYATHARKIKNRAIINRDPLAVQMRDMRSLIEKLQDELLHFHSAPEEIKILKQKVYLVEESERELQEELQECRLQLRNREVDCREKDSEIIYLKEAVANLTRQLDSKKDGFNHQENLISIEQVYGLSNEKEQTKEWRSSQPSPLSDGVCCSCSTKSQCKTNKCKCQSLLGSCSTSCSCNPKKCSNRGSGILLQTSLFEKPITSNVAGISRNPLSDIGNKLAKPSSSKTNAKKKLLSSLLNKNQLKVVKTKSGNENIGL